mgnify:FL=1
MKGPSLYKNGALGKTIKVQKDYSGKEDGRATSSPLQQLIPEPPPQIPQKIQPASPVQQRLSSTKGGGEGQDQDKIFNKKGEHVGDYVNGKKVMLKKGMTKGISKLTPKEITALNNKMKK